MPQEKDEYDLIVIGGGPAGLIGARTAAAYGQRVAIIDRQQQLGGAAINTGTVPSKTLRETALALSGIRSRQLYGVDLSLRRDATVADFLGHERDVTEAFHASISHQLSTDHSESIVGSAAFVDSHTIRVTGNSESGDRTLHAKFVLIATGSAPVHPPNFPFDRPGIYDSDSILQLPTLPRSMAVIGAGVIGSEYACTFAALGIEVHVVDGRDVLLPFLDSELSKALEAAMAKNGIRFHWKQMVEGCRAESADPPVHSLKMASGEVLKVDAVLVAAGRKSNVEEMNLSAAGITPGDRGLISVDEHFRTSVPHVYAAGDVIGFPALASTSMEQARRAVRHALGRSHASDALGLLPTGIYTIPEASTVGDTEEAVKKAGTPYVIGRATYRENARGRIVGDDDGFLKLIFHRESLKLLGAHVIGEHATELIHIGVMAMLAEEGVTVFDRMCFNFPTLSSLYKVATLDALMTIEKQKG